MAFKRSRVRFPSAPPKNQPLARHAKALCHQIAPKITLTVRVLSVSHVYPADSAVSAGSVFFSRYAWTFSSASRFSSSSTIL
jgi:hypothetical protein